MSSHGRKAQEHVEGSSKNKLPCKAVVLPEPSYLAWHAFKKAQGLSEVMVAGGGSRGTSWSWVREECSHR